MGAVRDQTQHYRGPTRLYGITYTLTLYMTAGKYTPIIILENVLMML